MAQPLGSGRSQRRRSDESPSRKDWWDKAAIVSSFVSSVVLAIVGLLISYTIQQAQMRASAANTQAQIDAAAIRAREDHQIQHGQLTAQLLQHLVSQEPAQRKIAVIALRTAVPKATYDAVVEILAASDSNAAVRTLAIQHMGTSSAPTAATTLDAIAQDQSRPIGERQMAVKSTLEIGVRDSISFHRNSTTTVFALAASSAKDLAFDIRTDTGNITGAFTHALIRSLRGGADLNRDGMVKASELSSAVLAEVKRTFPVQTPVAAVSGEDDIVVAVTSGKVRSPYRKTYGLFVGTNPQSGKFPLLPSVSADATAVATLMNMAGSDTTTLLGTHATEASLEQALRKLEATVGEDDLFVFYFSGVAVVGDDGVVRWLLADSSEASGLTAHDINLVLKRIRARHKVLLIDSCHAAAISDVAV